MSRIIQVQVGPLVAASASNIALSQTTSGAGALTLNGSAASGGVATLDQPRHIILTEGGNDSSLTFTATGFDFGGNAISATVPGATTSSVVDFGVSFKSVTSITVSGTTSAGGVTVGTNTVADSRPIMLDPYGFAPTSIQIDVTGAVTCTANQTLDPFFDPNWLQGTGGTPFALSNATWINHPDTNLVSTTVSVQGNYAYVPTFTRLTLNSGTGSAIMTVIQAASPS